MPPREPQLDLFPSPSTEVKPAPGRTGPRLWIRRLVVWSKPGEVIREVRFRPGLNIIWSPDPDGGAGDALGRDRSLGHGGGKTLLCRLLRYCLGEDRFAPEALRDRIGHAFVNGAVGVELILDGAEWAVIRPIGHTRRHVAAPASSAEDLLDRQAYPTSDGIRPLIDAVTERLLTTDIAALIPGPRDDRAWLNALAWLTRDQECHFGHVLEWRAVASDSDSPARGLARGETLDALRAYVGAIGADEHAVRAQLARTEEKRKKAEQDEAHLDWAAHRTRRHLVESLELDASSLRDDRLSVDLLRKAARARLAEVAATPESGIAHDLDALRDAHREIRDEIERLRTAKAEASSRIPIIERLITQLKSELPAISAAEDIAAHPVCPVCEVPIDRVLAEGCKLSHNLPDLEAARARYQARLEQIEEEETNLEQTLTALEDAEARLPEVVSREQDLRRSIASVERSRDRQSDRWFQARRLIDEVSRFATHLNDRDTATERAAAAAAKIEDQKTALDELRATHVTTINRMSELFDYVVRALVGQSARGHLRLTRVGLETSIHLGGDRSSAAIDSIKVLAFDLAAMMLSIEGHAHTPAFLLHDSPRVADLGLTVYHRLFTLVADLENLNGGQTPLFQYIVTTTTAPPDQLTADPYLRLTLKGSPASERLLGRDL